MCTIEDRSRNRHTMAHLVSKANNARIVVIADRLVTVIIGDNILDTFTQRLDIAAFTISIQQFANLLTNAGTSPTKVGFKNLPDIHAARNTQRVQHDISVCTISKKRHVFNRQNARNNTLVSMAACHLVTWLDFALNRDKNLDHFHDSRRHLVTTLDFFDLVHEATLKSILGFVVLLAQCFDLALELFILDGKLPPLGTRKFIHDSFIKAGAFLEALRPFNS